MKYNEVADMCWGIGFLIIMIGIMGLSAFNKLPVQYFNYMLFFSFGMVVYRWSIEGKLNRK